MGKKCHYSDVTWVSRRLESPATLLFISQLSRTSNKENTKARSALLAIFEGNPLVTDGFTAQNTTIHDIGLANKTTAQWTHDAIITTLWRQNDVATSFWRHNHVTIASCVGWEYAWWMVDGIDFLSDTPPYWRDFTFARTKAPQSFYLIMWYSYLQWI